MSRHSIEQPSYTPDEVTLAWGYLQLHLQAMEHFRDYKDYDPEIAGFMRATYLPHRSEKFLQHTADAQRDRSAYELEVPAEADQPALYRLHQIAFVGLLRHLANPPARSAARGRHRRA